MVSGNNCVPHYLPTEHQLITFAGLQPYSLSRNSVSTNCLSHPTHVGKWVLEKK